MNNSNHKKIIAREGLVIIGIVLLSVVFIKIHDLQFQIPFHDVDFSVFPEHSFSTLEEKNGSVLPVVDFVNGIAIVFKSKPTEKEIETAYTRKDKSKIDSFIVIDDDRYYQIGFAFLNMKFGMITFDFEYLGRMLLAFVYPVYLFSRFIIWAMRRKEKTAATNRKGVIECPFCHSQIKPKSRGNSSSDIVITLLLLLCWFVPGIIYAIWISGKKVCPECRMKLD